MLTITYAEQDAPLAATLQRDMSASSLTLEHPYLLVLVSRQSASDESIQSAVKNALKEQQRVVPVLLESGAAVPADLQGVKAIDLSGGYQAARVIGALKRLDIGEDRIRRNWRILMAIMVIVGLAFAASIWGITGGMIRFPVEEYATENARTDATLQALVGPTLEMIVPRTTEDAANFRITLEAAPRRAGELAAQTATAQVKVLPTATAQP